MTVRERIFNFLKEHRVAFGVAFVVGLLSALPVILAPIALQGEYQGIQFLYLDDETTYRARIQEVLDGYPGVSSPFLYEYKNEKTVVPPIGEYFYVIPSLFFGLSGAIVLAKFLFPATLFFFVYFLVFLLLYNEEQKVRLLSSVALGVFVTLGFDLVDYVKISQLLSFPDNLNLLIWTRLVNPITGALILAAILLIVWKTFALKPRPILILPLEVLLGLSVGYFFTLATSFAVVGLLFLITILGREYHRSVIFGAGMLLGFFLDLPYWISVFSSIGGVDGSLVATKNGMDFTHAFILNKLVLVTSLFALITFAYASVHNRDVLSQNKKTLEFLFVLLLACWVVLNQQVVTGRAVWPPHFVQYTIPFSAIIVLSLGALVWRRVFPLLWNLGLWSIILASFFVGMHSSWSYVFKIEQFQILQEKYSPLVSYLNVNAERDCVVLAREYNEEIQRIIPAYTRCNVYGTQNVYSLPPDRVLHNFLLRMRLVGVELKDTENYLLQREGEVRYHLFSDWAQMFGHGKDEWFVSTIRFVSSEYAHFLQGDLFSQLRKYKVDYLYAQKPLAPEILKQLGVAFVATSTEQFVLYHVE